ncbi:hypothetical protein [Variovorax sp. MHTC-1]|uniref:hypothetical protein n=1 Tax=Variovorax sp. MHTC-1 TaxID=2495593 RepID=UPI000F88BD12|nr:hypothetical protein [Variovorax sp. MHTC-1]RST49385.1 hypothetical protein EJI01_24145 [Variovorax sp. MHTC-1]
MTFKKLHLAGADLSDYQLGEPMYAFDRSRFLGTVKPVEVNSDKSEVRVSRFLPAPSVVAEHRHLGPLLLVEATMFLAERFPSIQNVHFMLSREIENSDGTMVAAARVELLRSIGATDVHAQPKPDSSKPGNFVVHGLWSYAEHNLVALRSALAMRRELYREHLAHVPMEERSGPLRHRLKQWWRAMTHEAGSSRREALPKG